MGMCQVTPTPKWWFSRWPPVKTSSKSCIYVAFMGVLGGLQASELARQEHGEGEGWRSEVGRLVVLPSHFRHIRHVKAETSSLV